MQRTENMPLWHAGFLRSKLVFMTGIVFRLTLTGPGLPDNKRTGRTENPAGLTDSNSVQ
jgi:hypothetical protein